MEYPERPECDFSTGQQLEMFKPAVHCVYCGKATYSPHHVTKHTGNMTIELPFCNEQHAQDYYLEKLRESEGLA